MSRRTVAEVVVETLQSAGVEHCWGVPGDTLNYVTDSAPAAKPPTSSWRTWTHSMPPSRPGSVEGKDSRVPPSLSDTDAHNWPRAAAKERRARLLSPSSTGCRVTFISSPG